MFVDERLRRGTSQHPSADYCSNIGAALLRRRRQPRNRIAFPSCAQCGIADGKYVGMAGNREIGTDLEAPGVIGFGTQPARSRRSHTPAAHNTVLAAMRWLFTSTPASSMCSTLPFKTTSTPSFSSDTFAVAESFSGKVGSMRGAACTSITRAFAGSK